LADYPEDFQKAVDDLIDNWEGGYVFDPDDPGGMTKFGISKAAYPNLDIKALTRDGAVAIYFRDYWQKYNLDKLPLTENRTAADGSNFSTTKDLTTKDSDETSRFRAKIFNMGVLMGPKTAIVLSVGCQDLDEYRQVCKRHFEAIVMKHPGEAKFLKGWTRRALA